MCVSIIHIQTLVHELQSKQFFYKLGYLTLTFDLVTLTLGQLLHLIDINHVCKYHLYLIIGSWYIVKIRFSQNCIFDLDLWPCDLDLRSTLKSYWYQSYVQVSSISGHWFMNYSQNIFFYNLACLTLTFDLVTLTLGELHHHTDIYNMCKWYQYLSIRWFVINCTSFFLHYCLFDLDLWPCDLDLRSTSTTH